VEVLFGILGRGDDSGIGGRALAAVGRLQRKGRQSVIFDGLTKNALDNYIPITLGIRVVRWFIFKPNLQFWYIL
jgi:hypothetical protein